ncbi:MAG: stage 0 sporulation protein [Chitinispirillaceae bacterium]|nr:stage 0 sporulation protein [Chitinispirillaceae bacterium]
MGKNSKLVEVVFKGERRAIYRDRNDIEIKEGEHIIVEAERGQDMGKASCVGSLIRLKRGKGETKSVIRKAVPEDLATLAKNQEKEKAAFALCKEKILTYKLDMKLVGVEMQFDGSKITFFFTAAQRVDFRELVKDLASAYRTRIELRQIGVRDEAKRICGLGICGRKQCCCAFLTEFEQITTQMAKNQQLALNPTKISGNCGRLLCCLRYEDDLYQSIFKAFPEIGSRVKINGKNGMLDFINIFSDKGLIRYEDGTQEWLGADDITKGRHQHAT